MNKDRIIKCILNLRPGANKEFLDGLTFENLHQLLERLTEEIKGYSPDVSPEPEPAG